MSGVDHDYRKRNHSSQGEGSRSFFRSFKAVIQHPLIEGGNMFTLKPISLDSVGGALAKAERYRLLNEPSEAESICRDILEVDPANREARISMILALTDEFPKEEGAFASAVGAMSGLETAYDRSYYSGIAWERRAKASYDAGRLGSSGYVYDWIVKALRLFEEAERVRPS